VKIEELVKLLEEAKLLGATDVWLDDGFGKSDGEYRGFKTYIRESNFLGKDVKNKNFLAIVKK
jgi:hypothetical protein